MAGSWSRRRGRYRRRRRHPHCIGSEDPSYCANEIRFPKSTAWRTCGFLRTEANGAFDAKGSVGIQGAIFRRHRAVLPHAGNCIGTIEFHIQVLGCCRDTGMSTMLRKMMIGLAAVAIVAAATTMSASTLSASAQQKKVRVSIPKEVCETVTVSTQSWGEQTVQVCGPPGGPRGQATTIRPKLKHHQTHWPAW